MDVKGDRTITSIAALRCGPVTRQHLKADICDLKRWGKENAKYILQKEPVTKQQGFVVVTGVRKTEWCQILCSSSYERNISPGGSVGVPVVANVDARLTHGTSEALTPGWLEWRANSYNVLYPIAKC